MRPLPVLLTIVITLFFQSAYSQNCTGLIIHQDPKHDTCPPFQTELKIQLSGTANAYILKTNTGVISGEYPRDSVVMLYIDKPGYYIAVLTIIDTTAGCTDSSYYPLFTVGGPVGEFYLPDSTCTSSPVTISGTTENAVSSVLIFGGNNGFVTDTALSHHDTISHIFNYNIPADYSPTVILTDSLGCSVTYDVGSITSIDCDTTCTAQFDVFSSFSPCPPFPVQFTNTSTGSNLSYEWDFGDGYSSTDSTPLHVYFFPGEYDVTLIVHNNACSDTIQMPALITVRGPKGNFSADIDSGCAPLTVSFSGTVSNTVSIVADLGDGPPYFDTIDVTHTYTTPGNYYAVYTLEDTLGCMVSYPVDTIVALVCAGINEGHEQLNRLQIYPVPAENNITIEYSQTDNEAFLIVVNLLGQTVLTKQIVPGRKVELNISSLPPGLYMCYLKSNTGVVASSKLIKL